jgi:hypothetical protein
MQLVAKATIFATVVGTGAWLIGLSRIVWPAHPMLATFALTIFAYALARWMWPSAR